MSRSSNGSEVDLTGRTAIVTGGTRGIGRAIAEALHRAGARVVVCGRTEPAALPRDIAFLQADVRDPEQANAFVAQAVTHLGRLDLAINNAGGSPTVPAAELPAKLATRIVGLNLLAPFYVSQAAHDVMHRQDAGGTILNIGSVAALRPAPGTALYAAAKAGLATLTRALAIEWAPKVRVNCITTGLTRTENNTDHYGDEATIAAVSATVPAGRMATPQDIANACLLLASPMAQYVTGANLAVDGGGEFPAYALAIGAAGTAPRA